MGPGVVRAPVCFDERLPLPELEGKEGGLTTTVGNSADCTISDRERPCLPKDGGNSASLENEDEESGLLGLTGRLRGSLYRLAGPARGVD